RLISVRVDTVDVGDGRRVQREVVEHPGAVVMAPVDDQGRLLLVRQYRHAAGEELLELPAGTLEPDEAPEATARRELREETGFAAQRWTPMGGFYTAPGFSDEYLHFFIARDLRPDPRPRDPDEQIELVAVPLDRATDLVRSGEIKDAKTIAGLLLLQLAKETC
ncbi:MAG: NUDIX hydrolase, partial [Dehalococcoidia bacterium]